MPKKKGNIQQTGLNGTLSARTAIFFRLNEFYQPVELISDIQPGLNTNRVTLDVIEGESYNQSYSVTDNALQDFSFATSNIRRMPRTISITGVLSSILPKGSVLPSVVYGKATPNKDRADLVRFQNLEALANECLPVGVYTPRHAFPLCAITGIDATWATDTGINTRISISVKEIKIATPLQGNFVSDYNALIVKKAINNTLGIKTPEPVGTLPSQIYYTPQNFVY